MASRLPIAIVDRDCMAQSVCLLISSDTVRLLGVIAPKHVISQAMIWMILLHVLDFVKKGRSELRIDLKLEGFYRVSSPWKALYWVGHYGATPSVSR